MFEKILQRICANSVVILPHFQVMVSVGCCMVIGLINGLAVVNGPVVMRSATSYFRRARSVITGGRDDGFQMTTNCPRVPRGTALSGSSPTRAENDQDSHSKTTPDQPFLVM